MTTEAPKFDPITVSSLPYSSSMYTTDLSLQVDAFMHQVTVRALDDRLSMSFDMRPAVARALAAELIAAADAAEPQEPQT